MASGLWIFSTSYLVAILVFVTARPRSPHPVEDFHYRSFTISKKPCRDANDIEGVCMFTWDCISKNGKLLSTCLDGFLLGTCCQLEPNITTPKPSTTSTPQTILSSFSSPTPSLSSTSSTLKKPSGSTTHAGSSIINYVSKAPSWASVSVSPSRPSTAPTPSKNTNGAKRPATTRPSSSGTSATVSTLLTSSLKLSTKDIQQEVHNMLSIPPPPDLQSITPTRFPTISKKPTTAQLPQQSTSSPSLRPVTLSLRPMTQLQKFPSTTLTTTLVSTIGSNKSKPFSSTSAIKPTSTKKPIMKPTVQSSSKPRPVKPTSSTTAAPPSLSQALTSSSVLSIIHQLTGSGSGTLSTSTSEVHPSKRPLSKLPSNYTTTNATPKPTSTMKPLTTSASATITKTATPVSLQSTNTHSTTVASTASTSVPALPKPLPQQSTSTTTPATANTYRPSPGSKPSGALLTTPPVKVTPTLFQNLLTTFMRPPVILSTTGTRPTPTMPSSLWTPWPSKLKYTLRPKPPMKPTKDPPTSTTAISATTTPPPSTVPITKKPTTQTSTINYTKPTIVTHRPTTIVFDWTDSPGINLTASDSTQSLKPGSTHSNILGNNEILTVSDSTTQTTAQEMQTVIHQRPTTVEIGGDTNYLTSQFEDDSAENTNSSPPKPTTTTAVITSGQTQPPPWVTMFTSIFPTRTPSPSQQTMLTSTSQVSSTSSNPNTQLLTTVTTPLPAAKPTQLSTTQRPHWDYRKDCGVRPLRPQGRIVGGRNAQFGAWPWQVLVKEATWLGLFVKNKCGGVLINSKWVITAAHCQPSFLATLLVVLGEHDLTGDYEALKPVTKNVRRMVVHRNYNSHTFENDIALLELETPVKFQPHVVPICLPIGNENFVGRMATVTGWGKLSHGGNVPSVLQEVHVPIVTNSKCQKMFLSAGHIKIIKETFICAGYENGGLDSCEGDSGGPLMVQRDDGRWVLAGTVSHGIRCADPNLPGVYMRTSAYKPWMESIMTKS